MENSMKTFCMGDIHGRSRALIQVLERANFNKEEDTLIFVGDIVDRGFEPFKCIEILLEIKNLIPITGNHDFNFYEYIQSGHDGFNGKNGNQITKILWMGEGDMGRRMNIIGYFKKTIPYYVDEKNRIFTHGGFDNFQFVDQQHESMFAWDRELWKFALQYKGNLIPTVGCFPEIFIGHTPTIVYSENEKRSPEGIIIESGDPITYPMFRAGIWNMDTGAGFSEGKLSMMNIETHEIFQSDLIKNLYASC